MGSKSSMKKSCVREAADGVAPSVFGNSAISFKEEVETEDAAENISWQKCRGCAFICGAHESKCMVCGTHNPAQDHTADIVDVTKLVGAMAASPQDDKASVSTASPENSSVEDCDGDEDVDSGSEDGDFIADTLDVPPPEGTLVRVLNQDDEWQLAKVVKACGTKARLCFGDGERAVLDFSVHAIRLADFDDEECSHVEDEELLGTLSEVPPIGTLVEILLENNKWEPARIIASRGTIARIVDSDGDEEELDFDKYAVRLHDYAL